MAFAKRIGVDLRKVAWRWQRLKDAPSEVQDRGSLRPMWAKAKGGSHHQRGSHVKIVAMRKLTQGTHLTRGKVRDAEES